MDDEMTLAGAGVAAVGVGLVLLGWLLDRWHRPATRLHAARRRLTLLVSRSFLVEPCGRCLEAEMDLLDVSPAGRSVQYRCVHCGKRTRSPASGPAAAGAVGLWAALVPLAEAAGEPPGVRFGTPAAPLPYEQTTRTPIPTAVRAEVWRRDGGRCVGCGSRENLQFDHVIPVARGGAGTVANLQVLCRGCNLHKRASV